MKGDRPPRASLSELMNHDAAAGGRRDPARPSDLGGEDTAASLASLRQRCPGTRARAHRGRRHRPAPRRGDEGRAAAWSHKSEPRRETILRGNREGRRRRGLAQIAALMGEVPRAFSPAQATPRGAPPVDPDARRIAQSDAGAEREIVADDDCAARVRSNWLVASELGMSEHTLRNHLTTILQQIGSFAGGSNCTCTPRMAAHGLGAQRTRRPADPGRRSHRRDRSHSLPRSSRANGDRPAGACTAAPRDRRPPISGKRLVMVPGGASMRRRQGLFGSDTNKPLSSGPPVRQPAAVAAPHQPDPRWSAAVRPNWGSTPVHGGIRLPLRAHR